MFRCFICAAEAEALPTGMADVLGGTHYVYTTPKGWWSITTPYEMKLFCPDEAITSDVFETDYRADTGGS